MKKDKQKLLLVAQEIHFARALAGNDKFLRERALRRLKKWLISKSKESTEFTEEGFMRLWKGLFYCVWMSDKPLVQEETVEAISQLVHCFDKFDDSRKFIRCFFQSMSQAWFGLDQHRIDKYMMLIRRFVRQSLEVVRNNDWSDIKLKDFSDDFYKALLNAPFGLLLHLADIYLEELAKVGREELTDDQLIQCLRPWVHFLSSLTDPRVMSSIENNIFLNLIRQTDEGIKHRLKFESWKKIGFKGGNINVMQEVDEDDVSDLEDCVSPFENDKPEEMEEEQIEEEEEEEESNALDPRAGRVDAVLPAINFSPAFIISLFESYLYLKDTTTKGRRLMNKLIKCFKKLESGKYPLGTHKVEEIETDDYFDKVETAVEDLMKFDDMNYVTSGSLNKKTAKRYLEQKVNPPKKKRRRSVSISWDVSDIEESSKEAMLTDSPARLLNSWTVNKMDVSKNVNGEKNVKQTKKKKSISSNGQDEEYGETVITIKNTPKMTLGTPNNILKNKKTCLRSPKSSGKKVNFVLSKNRSQEAEEYVRSVENSPTIPFDATKKPQQGVLKSTNIISPINPFYKKLFKKQLCR